MGPTAKVVGLVIAGVALVVVLAGFGMYELSEMRLNRTVTVSGDSVAVPTDIGSIQRGQHLASAVAICLDCHGPSLAGRVIVDDAGIGRIVAPNLTRGRGGVGSSLSDADFLRAIRHGVDPAGHLLLVMPSDDYNHFGDSDLGAIIAYVRSLPPINTALPISEVRPVGRVLFALDQLPLVPAEKIDQTAPRPAPPIPTPTAEYGAYLAASAGCMRCHGPGLSGGKVPGAAAGAKPASNITPTALRDWSDADFFGVMRTGRRPDGRALDSSMPWPYYAQLTDTELRAIWRFLQATPPRESGTQ
jgi:mono/diheme cytochrome c family protein